MRQPNRIILTAAAARPHQLRLRRRPYTYYDQCLLQQFDCARDLAELARRTRSCVENLERRMGVRQLPAADVRRRRGRTT
jgi:hypothetical protein